MTSSQGPHIPAHVDPEGCLRAYVRVAALGDSLTFGLGDPVSGGHRGWARILADALAQDHDISFVNLARPGATAAAVHQEQLEPALAHGPHFATFIVGLNDTLRSDFEAGRFARDVLASADALADRGALLMTALLHDHGRVFPLPRFLKRRLTDRISRVNDAFREVHQRYGGIQVDIGDHPGAYDREFWTLDHLHPSELGHRALAHEFSLALEEMGLPFRPPSLQLDGLHPSRRQELARLITEGTPWAARRVRDLAPSAARAALHRRLASTSRNVLPAA